MSDPFLWVKWVHILSATVLFGTGLGTAFHMLATHLRGNVIAIAGMTRNTVLADWLFTAVAGVVQPITGFWMIYLAGYDFLESWLITTYALYVVAGACWLKVVQLQYHMRKYALLAAERNEALPMEYHQDMRLWIILGCPAFLSLVIAFALMVMKPQLW
ncbi:MAG: DUF2269 domain-containing protein [Rhodospirillales bacterium]|nr:DUF2269 domain-containing protein [Rhodospirillales bacterium]